MDARHTAVFFVLAHVASIRVKLGERVAAGAIVAAVGNNGYARHPHIHKVFANSLFAPPAKRIMASMLDVATVTCGTWFVASAIASNWYPYAILAWLVPAAYWVYETSCLIAWKGSSLGRNLFDIQVVSAVGAHDLALWQAFVRPAIRVAMYAALLVYFHPPPVHQLDVAAIPLLAEVALLYTPFSLTVADFVSRTRVINTPPPQPHRAPAGPMYSATDAEFGYRPRRRR